MMTQEQFERLPAELADIVICDRRMGNIARRPIADFAEFKRLRELRAEARQAADRLWGYTARTTTDGTSPSRA